MADGGVSNDMSGTVQGVVVQAGRIDQVVLPAPESVVVPRQLPAAVPDFCGRLAHVAALDALLAESERNAGGGATVVALDGSAGAGKSTLAVWWAHRVQDRFPGGTLFVNLRGFGPSAPLPPQVVLTDFLTALGVAERRIPEGVEAQGALFRSLVTVRRALVVLDNAGSAEQVRPLLPGAAGSLALVTSRGALSELLVSEAVRRVAVDVFDAVDAVRLVESVVGEARTAAEPDAVEELVGVCARLPLAVRVAATRVASRPFLSVADVVEEIREEQRGLIGMEGPWRGLSGVRAVFDWSYDRLDPVHARVFRLLGLHPMPEFGAPAVAALAALDLRSVTHVLEELAEQHLVEPVARLQYRMHDLLHDYAAYRADLDETPVAREEAVARLLGWYAAVADAADRLVYPVSARIPVELPVVQAPVRDREEALGWLRSERAVLSAVHRIALNQGMYDVAIALALSSRHLGLGPRSWWPEELEAKSRGIEAARVSGVREAEAFLRVLRGHSHRSAGDQAAAEADFRDVAESAERSGDQVLRRRALAGLANLREAQERYDEAAEYHLAVWEATRQEGDSAAEAITLGNLCLVNAKRGRFDEALDYAQRAWELRSRTGNPLIIAYAEDDLALARQGLREHDTAIGLWEKVVDVYARHSGAESHLATALEAMAVSLVATGRDDRAVHDLRRAATILADLDDPRADLVRRRAEDLASARADGPGQSADRPQAGQSGSGSGDS
ncbi:MULTISPECIES: ATP-binding protein [Saccharothrix]|uniref:ATP-binding protein n=1 Tax=Saccharothrix TaxID=2071 RepID=UPI000AFAB1B1|nr:tetratricopeptide repeat protein [Saccharothrix sp. CB00851]